MASRKGRDLHEQLDRLEVGQQQTQRHLVGIDKTLHAVSKVFELMHDRFERLEQGQQTLVEGQQALVEGQKALVAGQKLVVERLDRLVEATTRERTLSIERLARIELRLEAVERRLDQRPDP